MADDMGRAHCPVVRARVLWLAARSRRGLLLSLVCNTGAGLRSARYAPLPQDGKSSSVVLARMIRCTGFR